MGQIVARTCNPSTRAEVGRLSQVHGQSGPYSERDLHGQSETLSQKSKAGLERWLSS